MKPIVGRIVPLAAFLVALAGCTGSYGEGGGAGSSESPAPADLVAHDFKFSPASLEMTHGTNASLEVRNDDTVRHNLMQSFNFGLDVDLPPGKVTSAQFHVPAGLGTYQVPCKYHADRGMQLTVVVT